MKARYRQEIPLLENAKKKVMKKNLVAEIFCITNSSDFSLDKVA